jgi:hypothetical protein
MSDIVNESFLFWNSKALSFQYDDLVELTENERSKKYIIYLLNLLIYII